MSEAPPRPLLVYDGDCNFCRRWVRRWQALTGDAVDYQSYQEASARFPSIPVEAFRRAVAFIAPGRPPCFGAEAVFRSLAHRRGKRWMLRLYEGVPAFASASEWFYGLVARHRAEFSSLTRLLWGDRLDPPRFDAVRAVFLRALGLVYAIAFVSLGVQIAGLVGSRGILPAGEFLNQVREKFGFAPFHLLPTLCWWNASDAFLKFLCAAGAAAGALAFFDLLAAPALLVCWVSYLSLSSVCQDFLGFQWDILLLEAGFLALWWAPWKLPFRRGPARPPSTTVLWLYRWLLFRLMFSSGLVKWLSGDPSWRGLAALNFHYQTQPLPTWLGWYAHHIPTAFQKASVFLVFVVELVVPFLVFAPRRFRAWAAGVLVAFQALIALTGNYGFFNLLAIALCLTLLDDDYLAALVPFARRWRAKPDAPPVPEGRFADAGRGARWALAGVLLLFGTYNTVGRFAGRAPAWLEQSATALAPWRVVNPYGLFAVMTTVRPEIVVEGSDDGIVWLPYEFKWKPGDVKRRPAFVAPHQPRLDWQMWFASLGGYQDNLWFLSFLVRLLEGSEPVAGLLQSNPFPAHPPRYLRAVVFLYEYTSSDERAKEGAWWKRELRGLYCPVVSLKPN